MALTFRVRVLRAVAFAALCAGLAGCQNVESTSPNAPQVRFITASPDAPGLDFYFGNGALAYNLGPNTQTNYIPLSAGSSGAVSADRSATTQVLASASLQPRSGQHYTVIAGNTLSGLQLTMLPDAAQPAAAGEIGVRLVDQRTAPGGVDVYFVPSGGRLLGTAPVATGLAFGSNTGYLTLPAGTYQVEVLPAGTVPVVSTVAVYRGASVSYAPGSMQTFVLNTQADGGVGVIALADYPAS